MNTAPSKKKNDAAAAAHARKLGAGIAAMLLLLAEDTFGSTDAALPPLLEAAKNALGAVEAALLQLSAPVGAHAPGAAITAPSPKRRQRGEQEFKPVTAASLLPAEAAAAHALKPDTTTWLPPAAEAAAAAVAHPKRPRPSCDAPEAAELAAPEEVSTALPRAPPRVAARPWVKANSARLRWLATHVGPDAWSRLGAKGRAALASERSEYSDVMRAFHTALAPLYEARTSGAADAPSPPAGTAKRLVRGAVAAALRLAAEARELKAASAPRPPAGAPPPMKGATISPLRASAQPFNAAKTIFAQSPVATAARALGAANAPQPPAGAPPRMNGATNSPLRASEHPRAAANAPLPPAGVVAAAHASVRRGALGAHLGACSYFPSSGGCNRGSECWFSHAELTKTQLRRERRRTAGTLTHASRRGKKRQATREKEALSKNQQNQKVS